MTGRGVTALKPPYSESHGRSHSMRRDLIEKERELALLMVASDRLHRKIQLLEERAADVAMVSSMDRLAVSDDAPSSSYVDSEGPLRERPDGSITTLVGAAAVRAERISKLRSKLAATERDVQRCHEDMKASHGKLATIQREESWRQGARAVVVEMTKIAAERVGLAPAEGSVSKGSGFGFTRDPQRAESAFESEFSFYERQRRAKALRPPARERQRGYRMKMRLKELEEELPYLRDIECMLEERTPAPGTPAAESVLRRIEHLQRPRGRSAHRDAPVAVPPHPLHRRGSGSASTGDIRAGMPARWNGPLGGSDALGIRPALC